MIGRALSTLLVLFGATAATGLDPSAELTGVITQVEGTVRLSGPGLGPVPLASPWQAVREGVTIRVPEGGAAGIVCSNRRFVHLRGPASWSLNQMACKAGKELTPADYALVAPKAGRFNVVRGILVLDRDMRTDDGGDPLAPSVLSPRNSALRIFRPTVSWLRISGAAQYQVEWTGVGLRGDTSRLDASDLICTAGPGGLDEVCSVPWPADRSDLRPGETFFLRVSARGGIAEPWHGNDPVEIRTLTLTDANKLENRLRDLASLGLEGIALDIARAGFLAREGLYSEAAEAYQRILTTTSSPELSVTLADLDLAMGLHRSAEPLYRQALMRGEPAVRAAAAFGLGRLFYARGRYREAAAAFRQAGGLYVEQKLNEEGVAARHAAARAEARIATSSSVP